jgi:MFS family permease
MASVPPSNRPRAGLLRNLSSAVPELLLYYLVVAFYFFALGMQFVLFPSLVAFFLTATPQGLGLAQSALSGPMFCFLLLGGLVAERAAAGATLARLYVAFAVATLLLAAAVAGGVISYPMLIAYAVAVGTLAAFMMPIRDAALNGIIAREAERGRHTSIATAATITTAVQIGAQIAGILAARFAGNAPASFIVVQGIALALGGIASLGLRTPKPRGHERTLAGVLNDLAAGLSYAFRNPVMSPMIMSAAYVGVFIIGSLQVLFPLVVRDEYGGNAQAQANRLGLLLACFWSASFVSAVVLSRLKPLGRPGRAMIVSHLVGACALGSFAFHKPFPLFVAIVAAWGLAAGVAISVSRSITQGASDQRYLGRVLAVYSMGFMGGAPLGSLAAGFAAQEWGSRTAALIPSLGLALAAVALAALTPLWRYRAGV